MKNLEINKRYGIKVIAVTTAFALTVSGLTGCAKNVSSSAAAVTTTEDTKSSDELEDQLDKAIGSGNVDDDNESSLSDPDDAPSKNEVVYIMADASGNCDKVVVSDWLKNTKGSTDISDVSNLKDITNTKGNAKYDLDSNGNLTWNADGKDVHYQGTSDKKPPVSVKVSYKLDGKDISPEDIAGKSGKVTIRFDYTNNETKTVNIGGKDEEIKVPFAMVSGIMLDSSKFSNVKVTNGKQIESGKSDMIVGMAFPGLSESIDLDGMKDKAKDEDAKKKIEDIQIPEYVEITANAKNFELQQTMTMASSDVLSQLDMTSDTIDTSNLTKSMNDLSNGMNSLEDGGKQLRDGTKTLKDGTADLSSGTHELASKSKDLDKGVSKLGDGAKELSDGAKSLNDGAKTLSSGLSDIDSGAGSLKDGADTLASGTSSLVSGASQLDNGAAQLQSGINSYSSAVDTYLGAGSQLQQGTASASQTSKLLTAYITQYISEDNSREANIESALESMLNQKASLQQSLAVSQMSLDEAEDEQEAAQTKLLSVAQGDEQVLKVVKGTEETEISVPTVVRGVTSTNTSTSSTSSTSTSGTTDKGNETSVDTNTSTISQSTETPGETSTSGMTENTGDGASIVSGTETSTESQGTGTSAETGSTSSALVMGYSNEQNDEDGDSSSDGSQMVNGSVKVTTPIVEDETINTVDPEEVQSAVASLQSANDNVVSMSRAVVMKQAQVETLDTSINQIYAAILQKKGVPAQTISGMTTDQIKAAVAGGLSVSTGELDNSTELYYIKQMSGGLSKGLNNLQTGEQNVYSGLSGKDTMGALRSGASDLKDGTSSAVSGAGELNSGAMKLASGASALKDGTAKAYSGSVTLMNGTNSLMTGSDSLLSGTGDLKAGTAKLVSGTEDLDDGAGKLDDGVSKLAEGVNDLTDGLFKFDDEGISKLTDLFGDNVTDVVDRLKAVENAGSDYTSFTGSSDNMESNVKFVYKTDAILVNDK